MSLDELHTYWRAPGADNTPDTYLEHPERSEFIAELVSTVVPKTARVVELGCNAGANLASLHAAGFTNLEGVEINPAAVALFREYRPDMADVVLHNMSIEDFVPDMGDVDVVFTVAVLEHLHPDSEWVFEALTRARFVLTLEDEGSHGWKHFPRDYGRVFGDLGMVEVRTVEDVGDPGLDDSFVGRLFARPE